MQGCSGTLEAGEGFVFVFDEGLNRPAAAAVAAAAAACRVMQLRAGAEETFPECGSDSAQRQGCCGWGADDYRRGGKGGVAQGEGGRDGVALKTEPSRSKRSKMPIYMYSHIYT